MKRLTTRSIATAEAIANREDFTTSGALFAHSGKPWRGAGRLRDEEYAVFNSDYREIVYTVYSYATPIAWVTRDGRVHKVDQKFSLTTTKHQGNLYLLTEEKTAA